MKIVRIIPEENLVLSPTEDSFYILPRINLENSGKNNAMSHFDININLLVEGISVELTYVDILQDQRIILNISVEHKAPKTKSRIIARIILGENASFNFCGNINLASEAGLSLGSLEAKSLVDGKNISWEARPNLLINNKSATATHKASLVDFNQEQMLYLQNRGLDKSEAKNALKRAFLAEAIEKIPSKEEQEKIWQELRL